MKLRHLTGWSILLSILLYVWFSWPLPLHFSRGIPAAAHPGEASVQPTIPGDHLQLLYHFWLPGDMFAGNTPWFYNLYEFNTGDDLERFAPGPYYAPFSLFYAAASALGGPAFGWNIASWLSIWLTLLFTWLLAHRFSTNIWLAGLAALVSITLPFRWINLFGGSPAGFAMAWVPAVWLGVDSAVRRQSFTGGLFAGISIVFASWGDTHVFFFTVLAVPLWCVLAWVLDDQSDKHRFLYYKKISLALLPVVVLTIASLMLPLLQKWAVLYVTGALPEKAAITSRSLKEIKLYSPPLRGLVATKLSGLAEQIFIGLPLIVLMFLGGWAFLSHWRNRTLYLRQLAVWLLLGISILLVCLLAAGVNGPGQGTLLKITRQLIPPYRMIRQTAKIFTIMPSLIAVLLVIIFNILLPDKDAGSIYTRWWKLTAAICLSTILFLGYSEQINPTISLLSPSQGAYEAVEMDTSASGKVPRALVLPLWPGDSHYTSIYQFYASHYHIRLLNGYRPFVRRNYLTDVFERLVSVNQGWLTDDQLNHLNDMQVTHIILHEDLFPEKVSPFPVGFTLQNLLKHPRLTLLKQDQTAWAFKISPPDSELPETETALWDTYGSSRRWSAEKLKHYNTTKKNTDNGICLELTQDKASVTTPAVGVWSAPNLRWLARLKGCGVLQAELISQAVNVPLNDLYVDHDDDWHWYDIPAEITNGYASLELKLTWQGGKMEVSQILLTAGKWLCDLPINESITLPAPLFFHAGYTDLKNQTVVLRETLDPQALIFYGPKLPLAAGRYLLELQHSTPASSGKLLGQFNLRQRSSDGIKWTPVFAGYPAQTEFELSDSLPFHLELLFKGEADLIIHAVKILRLL